MINICSWWGKRLQDINKSDILVCDIASLVLAVKLCYTSRAIQFVSRPYSPEVYTIVVMYGNFLATWLWSYQFPFILPCKKSLEFKSFNSNIWHHVWKKVSFIYIVKQIGFLQKKENMPVCKPPFGGKIPPWTVVHIFSSAGKSNPRKFTPEGLKYNTTKAFSLSVNKVSRDRYSTSIGTERWVKSKVNIRGASTRWAVNDTHKFNLNAYKIFKEFNWLEKYRS